MRSHNELTTGPTPLAVTIFIVRKGLYCWFLHDCRRLSLLSLLKNLSLISRKCWPQERLNVTPGKEPLAESLRILLHHCKNVLSLPAQNSALAQTVLSTYSKKEKKKRKIIWWPRRIDRNRPLELGKAATCVEMCWVGGFARCLTFLRNRTKHHGRKAETGLIQSLQELVEISLMCCFLSLGWLYFSKSFTLSLHVRSKGRTSKECDEETVCYFDENL